MCFILRDETKMYLDQLVKLQPYDKLDFYKLFSHLNVRLVNILVALLKLNPYFRPSAKECLKDSLFDTFIRDPEFENTGSKKILLDYDKDDAYDYIEGTSMFSEKDYLDIISVMAHKISKKRDEKVFEYQQQQQQYML